MATNLVQRSLLALTLVGGLCIALPSMGGADEALFEASHRQLDFSFVHDGEVISQRDWPQVMSPRKFTMEVVLRQAGAELTLMVFDLQERSGDWWLSTVMGFLFQPELEITSGLTAQGYETYEIRIPGGHGVFAQTEVLVIAPAQAYRFTCYNCVDDATIDALHDLVDSFVCSDSSLPSEGLREAAL